MNLTEVLQEIEKLKQELLLINNTETADSILKKRELGKSLNLLYRIECDLVLENLEKDNPESHRGLGAMLDDLWKK